MRSPARGTPPGRAHGLSVRQHAVDAVTVRMSCSRGVAQGCPPGAGPTPGTSSAARTRFCGWDTTGERGAMLQQRFWRRDRLDVLHERGRSRTVLVHSRVRAPQGLSRVARKLTAIAPHADRDRQNGGRIGLCRPRRLRGKEVTENRREATPAATAPAHDGFLGATTALLAHVAGWCVLLVDIERGRRRRRRSWRPPHAGSSATAAAASEATWSGDEVDDGDEHDDGDEGDGRGARGAPRTSWATLQGCHAERRDLRRSARVTFFVFATSPSPSRLRRRRFSCGRTGARRGDTATVEGVAHARRGAGPARRDVVRGARDGRARVQLG